MAELNTWDEDRIAKVCLGWFDGFGSRSLRKLWKSFDSPKQAWLAKPRALIAAGIKEKVALRFSDWRKKVDPQKFLRLLERQEIHILFPEDHAFPSALRHSADPPEILFVRGCLPDTPAVAVVGTRRATSYGRRCVELIVPELVRSGLAIVSGLALGIDALVHEATLEAHGVTLAILGTGVNDEAIYPRENYVLAKRMIEQGGGIVSEFPPGTGGRKEHFPIRNRLIASSALATLVIEASEKSGSLITAKLALEENREVLAVPGPIWSEPSKGTNTLLKLGAKVCTEAADVLQALALDRPELVAEARAILPLDPIEERIMHLLDEPQHVDALAKHAEKDAATISALLAMLELKGLVKSIGGQMWVKAHHSK